MRESKPQPLTLPPASPRRSTNLDTKSSSPMANAESPPTISLQPASNKKGPSKSRKLFHRFRAVFRSFPIITPSCKIPVSLHNGGRIGEGHIHGGIRMTGTLFGNRRARVSLAIQESPKCLPILVIELGIPTGKLLQDMGAGFVRVALECEKKPGDKTKIIDEPIWMLYCNGKKSGYGVRREATEDDLSVMQVLQAISMGAGVIPNDGGEKPDGEVMYMRAQFERVIGSKDSETYYMLNPDGNNGPELSLFFVRV
ncbi:protein MIZU-KUSSEI 1 [Argentina anserina]|uniref:protein MIZU-KUSSEI 1 n=1 Tax=Argentina anserina TaxID=57926 RepID=UPI0021767E74|nr:protein MIZU-KUSSEI 1 [Potentilla anserina]